MSENDIPSSSEIEVRGYSRREKNPRLFQTMCGDPSKMTPRRQLENDDGGEICHCKRVRSDTAECLTGLSKSSEPIDMAEKKRV